MTSTQCFQFSFLGQFLVLWEMHSTFASGALLFRPVLKSHPSFNIVLGLKVQISELVYINCVSLLNVFILVKLHDHSLASNFSSCSWEKRSTFLCLKVLEFAPLCHSWPHWQPLHFPPPGWWTRLPCAELFELCSTLASLSPWMLANMVSCLVHLQSNVLITQTITQEIHISHTRCFTKTGL